MILEENENLLEVLTEKELINKYLYMFELAKDSRYPISYGFECDDGWLALLNILFKKIAELDTEKLVKIFQIKEKFGGLRFYIEFNTSVKEEYSNPIYDLIQQAEHESYKICELCGATPASQTNTRWIKTLCKKCEEEINENKERISKQ